MAQDILVPALGESVSEAIIAKWLKKVGDAVKIDEPLAELETDKVTMEVPSPVSGVLTEIIAAEGKTVAVGGLIARVEAGATATAAPPTAATTVAASAPPVVAASVVPTPAAPVANIADSSGPAARKALAETGIDPTTIAGTGKDGRITKSDVAAAPSKVVTLAPAPISTPAATTSSPVIPAELEERVPMSRLRLKISERLKHAQNTAAMLTTFNEVDMSAVMQMRKEYKDVFEKQYGTKLGFMSFFVKAAVAALKQFPAVNAEIDGTDIIYKNYYNIGVAVSTENGLMVPVVRDADSLNFAEIEGQIVAFGKQARDGKLGVSALSGGTFTITNGGIFGSMLSTPILNPPQSAILGMHNIVERPVAIDGKVEIRPIMYLALSYDHRIIDGREAVSFLVKIKNAIENPQRLLLGV